MYNRNQRLWNICMDIYRELYAKADPPADFDELIKSGEAKRQKFFMNYYLSEENTERIVEEHIKKNKLKKHDAELVRAEIYLGASPTSVK